MPRNTTRWNSIPPARGVNFTVNLGPPDSPAAQKIRAARFDLQLTNVPLSQVLNYISDMTGTSFTTDDFSVIISPLGSSSPELIARNYRVPPDFISSMSAGHRCHGCRRGSVCCGARHRWPCSPSASAPRKLSPNKGSRFPKEPPPATRRPPSTLRVVNTSVNQDYIAQIVDALTKTEPVMVSVKVTMIKVEQTHLEELGFDWFLENAQFQGQPRGNRWNRG